jgi:hypothetical protein
MSVVEKNKESWYTVTVENISQKLLVLIATVNYQLLLNTPLGEHLNYKALVFNKQTLYFKGSIFFYYEIELI